MGGEAGLIIERYLPCQLQKMKKERNNGAVKAVIFDMDGLMFDTERLAADGWKYAGGILGFEIDDEKLSQTRGRNVADARNLFFEWYGEQVDYDEARSLRCEYLNGWLNQYGMPMKDGLTELLAYLKEKGYKRALATSTHRNTVEWYFELAGLPMDFEAVVCGDEVEHSKPAPDVFLLAAKKLDTDPGMCLVLEDSPNGIRAGASAGCKVVMVPDLDRPTEEIEKKCLKICENLREVKEILKSV